MNLKVDLRLHNDAILLVESSRLETFANWPHDRSWHCTPEKLAKSGFYFRPSKGSEDNVCCAFCQKELDFWDPNDDPMVEHKKHSPKCPFLSLNCPVENLTSEKFLSLVQAVTELRVNYYFDKAKSLFECQADATREEIIKHISQG